MSIAVTGATGQLGHQVIESLIERQVAPEEIVAVVRNADKAQDLADRGVRVAVAAYEDADALKAALEGVQRLVMVSGSEIGKRVAQHSNVIQAAQAAGVQLIAYTSLLGVETSTLNLAPEHRETEQLLAESGIGHVLLRNGWYWENYASAIAPAREYGKMFGAAGTARVNGAARRDYAEAAAAVITMEAQEGRVHELAGDPALSYPEIAARIGGLLEREVDYIDQTVEEYAQVLQQAGLPEQVAGFVAEMDRAIADGALESDSRDLQTLLGRPATTIAQALADSV